ncbi:MAG: histidinol phosphate phosphatase domain-containing protein [Candidatus Margulisbacteria bacterium]|nr:histidinol phosphate phosphatase domain-containing protein [Candidatus Margulisiibacteriota bacterium]MBU1617443.1 histidinol phosphate phosphatase domain-containing protein [Candidatus Margulisiibacteriota bacterium]MBU1867018.1 histidinol phosphate phosphatase domain-containing protein [Candidatus Margulisiibacteriota bacterium]
MDDLGQRIEFHSHSIFSDGLLLPAALVREAEVKGHMALAITDHVDESNLESVIKALTHFERETKGKLPLIFIPGVELSYIQPKYISNYAKKARKLGARLIIVHGESPVEAVYPGTNRAAVAANGIADILAHPGKLTAEEASLAAKHGVYLELTAKPGHNSTNRHVAAQAKLAGAKLIVDTDCHDEKGLISQEQALQICREAGLSDEEARIVVRDNARELLKRIERP